MKLKNLLKFNKAYRRRKININPVALGIIAFIVAAIWYNYQSTKNLTPSLQYHAEELNPTFPILYQIREGRKINEMRGFVSEQYDIVSNSTTCILQKNRELNLLIKNNGNKFNYIDYEIRDRTSGRLLERTKLDIFDSDRDKAKDETSLTLNIQNLIIQNTTYLLTIKINIHNRDIFYFTNIINRTKTDIDTALAKAEEFTDSTFRVASASNLVQYLETSINRDMREMYNVTLQQSFEQLTFADTGMKRVSEYYFNIYQAQEYSYNIVIRYLSKSKNEDKKEFFVNRDEYVLRWDGTRWYYMKFNRSTEELLNLDNELYDYEKQRFYIGVTNPKELVKIESQNKKYFAFSKRKEIYIYDNYAKQMINVFDYNMTSADSFAKVSDDYDVKILDVTDDGNLVYMVYGYNMTGLNEGNMGIAIFTYNIFTNSSSENVFLPMYTTFQSLKYDISRLCVYKNNRIIFKNYNKVYSIDIDTADMLTLASGFEETKFAASSNSRYFAFNSDKDGLSKNINIYNIEDGRVTTITANENENIEVVTFMNDDLFYGVFSDDDIWREAGKIIGRPSREIRVINAVTGKQDLFSEKGNYFYNFVNQQNVLRFNKYTRSGTHYAYYTNDVIVNNFFEENTDAFFYREEYTKEKLRIGYFELPINKNERIRHKKNDGIIRKPIEETALESLNEQEELIYYVYDSGNLKAKLKNLSDGINEIRDNYGYVKLSDRITCYNRANKGNVSYLRQKDYILDNMEGFVENVYIKDGTMLVMNITGVTERDLEYYLSLNQKVAVFKNDLFQFFITGYDNNNYVLEYSNGDRILTPRAEVHEAVVYGGYVLFAQIESLE